MVPRAPFVKLLPFVALCAVLTVSKPHAAPAADATLVEAEKVVEAQQPSGPWRAGKINDSLAYHEKLRTGELSRAAVRLSDLSMLRLDELTKIEILPPSPETTKPTLDLHSGAVYLFSRDKPKDYEIRTPAANGALRGTEIVVRVTGLETLLTVLDGEVELSNPQGRVVLRSGEQGVAKVGQAPRKTAAIYATNSVQWCLYYPGVLDPASLRLATDEQRTLAKSLEAYRAGDLLAALKAYGPGSAESVDGRVYRAAVVLAVGQAAKARQILTSVPADHPGRRALEQMIAAVTLSDWNGAAPTTSSGWIAESYDLQAHGKLDGALQAAHQAAELAPELGYAWERVAELEFAFGRTGPALQALDRSLSLSPLNAQAHALRGFLLSAENKISAARESFNTAIGIDGALGNAWLGRGLTYIRQGQSDVGRDDLQTAAVLEPNRSALRSYLGKAFSQVGLKDKARIETDRAAKLDPHDPTPWLYSAVEAKQENRYNEAVSDLEKSLDLNDSRRTYRSGFLLDQDRSIRGTNLAAIYQDDGMVDQSVREAVRAVDSDYSSAPAHLFLANSYDALRDPDRILLRYESPWFNELLLSNLLAPVGGGPLSQFVSQEEYSKMFERDGLGISSVTEYRGTGQILETASQYGTFGNFSYALDSQYQNGSGLYQPSSAISRLESYGTLKLQVTPQDTLFFQTKLETLRNGNLFQAYDPTQVGAMSVLVANGKGGLTKEEIPNQSNLTYSFHENQDPGLLLLGWHHEWSPGNQTLLLLGRLANRQTLASASTSQGVVFRDVSMFLPNGFMASANPFANRAALSLLEGLVGRGSVTDLNKANFDFDYKAGFETYTAELQQIATIGPTTAIAGARYQTGQFDTQVDLTNLRVPVNYKLEKSTLAPLFDNPPAHQLDIVGLERMSFYAYDIWHVTPWLSITGGITQDQLTYPDNFRNPPVNGRQDRLNKALPKAGVVLQPWKGAALRGAYVQSISGSSFDESVRLEPTQVAGFLQSYRTLISESVLGSVAGNKYDIYGLSFEQKLPSRTYLGLDCELRKQNVDRTIGVFDGLTGDRMYLAFLPSSIAEQDRYQEKAVTATVNQLLSDCWSIGSRYQFTLANLHQNFPALRSAASTATGTALEDLAPNGLMHTESGLHVLTLFALFNHPSGLFLRAEANWYHQGNHDFSSQPAIPGSASSKVQTVDFGPLGDTFWQVNLLAGYRFARNQCELSCGILDLNNQDYRLSPLDPYEELPRKRTFFARCRFSF